MYQFLSGHDRDYGDLEKRARGKCIRFKNQEMPPGANPPNAHVGFEVDMRTNKAKLLVTHGVTYRCENRDVNEWFIRGEKEFHTFNALKNWIKGDLAAVYNSNEIPVDGYDDGGDSSAPVTPPDTDELTDFSEVNAYVREAQRAFYIDEEELLEGLKYHIKGQDHVLEMLAKVVVLHSARQEPSRPAVLFSVGPSGVGKTKTGESLSKVLKSLDTDNAGYRFLRLDMSEYQEAYRVSQLIGSPQGYVGHGEGSQLIDALRLSARTVVLFDEIEKAHPAILKVLMNAMDAGRISVSSRGEGGYNVDCRQAIFIFTSTLDAEGVLTDIEQRNAYEDAATSDDICRRRLQAAGISPEIIGRIGRFLVYRQLSSTDRGEIVALSIVESAQEYGVQVKYIEPSVIVKLMERLGGNDFGARPGKYLIDDELGGIFVKAAKEGARDIHVCGPPFGYKPFAG